MPEVSDADAKPLERAEKQFYLESFRQRCIVLHLTDADELSTIDAVVEELAENRAMPLVIADRMSGRRHAVAVADRDHRRRGDALVEVTLRLLADSRANVVRPVERTRRASLRFSRELAVALGASKLVVIDRRGGLAGRSGVRSFASTGGIVRPGRRRAAHPEPGAVVWTAGELGELVAAVRAGVESVNLTRAEDLEAELYTYEGAGTLITAHTYCSVETLGVEQYSEAVRLLARGEREGFLLPRSPAERAKLVLSGFGAWFGQSRLAGVCGLETDVYARQKLGEVVGFYTISRFQGEGVGLRILEHVVDVATERGLRALFACTSNPRAAAFFERHGFVRVAADRVPRRKWIGRGRGPRPLVFWKDL